MSQISYTIAAVVQRIYYYYIPNHVIPNIPTCYTCMALKKQLLFKRGVFFVSIKEKLLHFV